MKHFVRKHVGQRGFIHHIVPIVAFVVLFAVIGAYFFLRGSLAATGDYIQSLASGNKCLSNLSGDALIEPCKASYSMATITSSKSGNKIEINGECLERSGAVAVFQASACGGSSSSDYWRVGYPVIWSDSGSLTCLGGTAGKPLGFEVGCSTIIVGTQNYYWSVTAVSSSSPTPTPAPVTGRGPTPVPAPASIPASEYYKTAAQPCTNYTYSGANIKTAYYCVAAMQDMLNAMKGLDGYNQTLTVDGQFGPATSGSLTDYQKYQNTSLGKKPITALGESSKRTWQFMCWSMHNHGWTTSGTAAGRGYTYVECTSDGYAPGVKPS